MSTSTAPAPLPTVPPDVAAFAADHGIGAYLPALLEMTRRIFPTAPMSLSINIDPEIPDWRQIIIAVTIPHWDTDEYLDWRDRWAKGFFAHCPSTHTHLFGLDITPHDPR
jgi:hypothetical protein